MFNFSYYYVDQMVGDTSVWPLVVTGLFTLGGVVFGIFLTRWLAKRDKLQKDKKALKDLLTEIELLGTPMRRQLEAIKDVVEKLRSDKDDVIIFSAVLNLNVDRLQTVDRSSLADHLEGSMKCRKDAMQTANRILVGCEAITRKYKEVRATVSDHSVLSRDIRRRWSEEVEHFDHLVFGFITDLIREHKDALDDPLLSAIDKVSNPKARQDRKDIYDVHVNHFVPLDTIWQKHLSDPRTIKLMDASREVQKCVNDLKREQNSTANRLEVIAECMKGDFDSLQKAVRSIPTTK